MIVTIVMILVLGFLGVAITTLSVTSTHNAVDELAAGEAFVLAESGLERGIKQWSLDPLTYASEGPVIFGNGSFTINATLLSATQARIVSSATVTSIGGNVIRSVEAVVDLGGAPFSDPMSNLTNWPTESISSNDGDHGFAGGGIRIRTDNTTNGATYTGYLETGTSPALISLSAGQTVQIDLEYKKRITGAGGGANPVSMDMAVELVSTTNISHTVWSEDTIFNNNSWLVAPTTNWTVPGGVTIDRIRLTFDLQRNGNGRRPWVFFRDLEISTTSGGGISITSWQENIP